MRTITFPAEVLEEFPTVTALQMKRIYKEMNDLSDSTLYQMMERAGSAVSEIARCYTSEIFPDVAVLLGNGSCTGGALVAARYLADKGARVQIMLTVKENDLDIAYSKQIRVLQGLHPESELHDLAEPGMDTLPPMPECDLIIDGLLGFEVIDELRPPIATLIKVANSAEVPTISVDLPSGLNPDTGKVAETAILATATVTLAVPKRGFLYEKAHEYLGELYLADIGICPKLISNIIENESYPRELPKIMYLYTHYKKNTEIS